MSSVDLSPNPQFKNEEMEFSETPVPLGPGRIALLRLPRNWNSRELPKLLKLIELALEEQRE